MSEPTKYDELVCFLRGRGGNDLLLREAAGAIEELLKGDKGNLAGGSNARATSLTVPFEPFRRQWDGLARDIVMWMDMYQGSQKTPRNLFRHLKNLGREVPDWLSKEPEMMVLDHVPSKGTRAVLIYKAMVDCASQGNGGRD